MQVKLYHEGHMNEQTPPLPQRQVEDPREPKCARRNQNQFPISKMLILANYTKWSLNWKQIKRTSRLLYTPEKVFAAVLLPRIAS